MTVGAFVPNPSLKLHNSVYCNRPTHLAAKKLEKDDNPTIIDVIKEKPATIVAVPFVVLIGLDLLANIFFLAKRTFEFFAFGKLPSTEVWFSDNLFLWGANF